MAAMVASLYSTGFRRPVFVSTSTQSNTPLIPSFSAPRLLVVNQGTLAQAKGMVLQSGKGSRFKFNLCETFTIFVVYAGILTKRKFRRKSNNSGSLANACALVSPDTPPLMICQPVICASWLG